ncbi:MAG: hypothetical protein A2583_08425 [Bdellovibrionales bacterium RIFOXYD1_FULL_53_11]|nr:MAG: hypothetical protein A2583_08425 [Bdellovibrionales bacterium RIFOXYD1_FULL_53_11]
MKYHIICLVLLLAAVVANAANASAAPDAATSGASTILVTLSASGECAKAACVAWLSKGRTLLYQADVSPNGTFEFHTLPGRYNLVVTGESGCFVEKPVDVSANKTKEIMLDLVRKERAPAGGMQ